MEHNICKAQSMLPAYRRLHLAHEVDDADCCVMAYSADEVLSARAAGCDPVNIFYRITDVTDIAPTLYQCRYVVDRIGLLPLIDAEAGKNLRGAERVSVGLQLLTPLYESDDLCGITIQQLQQSVEQIRGYRNISVRGCFLEGTLSGLQGRELARYFRACYETAKKMAWMVPCAMPFLCVNHGLRALEENLQLQPESVGEVLKAAEVVSQQNNTSFYAQLLIF